MSDHAPHHHDHHDDDGPRPLLIAVASQNARTVTPHAGRTRRFLLFTADADGTVAEAGRYELPKAMTLHGWPRSRPHPLFCVDVVVVGSAGENFRRKLAEVGVRVVVSADLAVRDAAARAVADTAAAR
ncbi:MAG: nitrogen fixation protein [Alphaproteobacteria bacterium]|jgi:predicted Fe-Mo cluster-binding NifX family protein|nr:nitrogen fixation protein [Alphaproteobacteria bacterium]